MTGKGAGRASEEKRSKKRHNPGRSKVGCLTCRDKHVKCDERLPTCRRCERLGLQCRPYWTKEAPTLKHMSPACRPLRPRCEMNTGSDAAEGDFLRPGSPFQEPGESAGSATPEAIANLMEFWIASDDGPDETEQSLDPRDLLRSISYAQVQYSLPTYHIPLPNALVLGKDEHLALRHYETIFALTQTPKDPLWSFPKLLLRKTSYSAMAMHFALAMSLHDLDAQHEVPDDAQSSNRLLAHHHFNNATSTFKDVMSHDHAVVDHLETLSCFYYIYVYMSRQKVVDKSKLNRLSRTVAEYIQHFSLDSCLTNPSKAVMPNATSPALFSFLCRLLFWVYKEDVHCTFYNCAGEVARYFKSKPRSLKDVWELSRPALPLNWGTEYPEPQCIADMNTSLAVDMTVEMLQLGFDITELGQSPLTPSMASPAIEAAFSLMEVKFATVFRVAASTVVRSSYEVVAFAAAATAIFHAWKICYYRYTEFFDEGIEQALNHLLKAAQRATSVADTSASFHSLQWALLVAGTETKDPIHREWILSKLTIPRYRSAFQTMMGMEAQSGSTVGVRTLGDILSGASLQVAT